MGTVMRNTCFAAILLSCLSIQVQAKEMVAHETIEQPAPHIRLVVGSSNLADALRLFDARVVHRGLFKAGKVSVQNLTDDRVTLEYKFDWMDADGFPVGDESGIWQRFTLGPREIRTFKSLGKSRRAALMQFTVRYPGDVFIENSLRQQNKWPGSTGGGAAANDDVLDMED